MSGIIAPFESFTALNQEQNSIKNCFSNENRFSYVQIYIHLLFFSSMTVVRNPET